jgi:hypothetical protein
MEMPRPGDAHARLHALVGEWSGDEVVHPAPWDPVGGPAKGRVTNTLALGGFAVVQEYQQYRNGVPNFAGHGLFWWDGDKNEYVLTWFDSMRGTPAEYRGGFQDGVLRLTSPMPGGGVSRCSFDCAASGRYAFALEISPDGSTWAPGLSGTYGRVAAGSAPRRPARAKAAKAAKAARRPARRAADSARRSKAARAKRAKPAAAASARARRGRSAAKTAAKGKK